MSIANVLICGLVRDLEKLKEKIKNFVQLKKEGLIDKIVYSTWIGEIDNYPGLKEFLDKNGVILVLTGQPALIVSGHRFHQMKNFYYGLQIFQDDDLILKTRVDLSGFDDTMRRYFSGEISLARKENSIFSVLSERVVVDYAQMMYPFIIGDAQFFGRKKDIEQFVNMDYFFDVAFKDIAVEQTFFSNPFVKRFPIFAVHYFWNLPHISQAHETFNHQIEVLLNSEHFLNLLATYHQILHANFIVGWVPKEHFDLYFMESVYGKGAKVDAASIFDRASPPYGIHIGHEGSITVHSNVLIERLVNGFLKNSVVSQHYLDALKRTNNLEFQNSFKINPASVPNEVADFYKNLEIRNPMPGESKVFNKGGNITQDNYIRAQEPVCFVANSDDALIRQYQADITFLRRLNHELSMEIKEFKYGSHASKVSFAHKILKKLLPESVRKKLREGMPVLVNLYRQYIKRAA